jgi:catechol 2,3-dioxygenase-like lactoylglutathione lyase family enzyme
MKFFCPLIVVRDLARSRKFYEEVLGQEVILDFGANITFDGNFSLQSLDSWQKFIEKEKAAIAFGSNSFELYFEENRFDEFLNKLSACPIEYIHPLVEYSWGQRVVRFYDPDHHIIEVGESMTCVVHRFYDQGLSIDEIASRTQHPVEFVKNCL